MSAAALLAVTSTTVVPGHAKNTYVYGPAPEWGQYKALAEAAIRAKLPLADKWAIEWPYGYVPGKWRHKGSFPGYLSCGMLRATEPIDGRALAQFATVIDYGTVRIVDISPKDRNSLVNVWCGQLIKRGFLPLASAMEGSADWPVTNLGLTIRPMAQGAYVVSVTDSQPAQVAGITAGTVLTRANGISLAGMGPAMAKLLDGDAAVWTFETATGNSIEVRRAQ